MTVKALREQRAKIALDAQELIKKGEKITKEEMAQFDTMMAKVDDLQAIIDRTEKAETLAASLGEPIDRLDPTRPAIAKALTPKDKEFYDWLRNGAAGGGTKQSRDFIHMPILNAATDPQSTSAGVGGEFIPVGFSNQLETARKQFGGMFNAGCTRMPTAEGNQINWPTMDDTTNEGALLAENTQDTVNQLVTSSKRLDAYKYTSKIVLVSVELMQDSFFSFDQVVGRALGERLGRIQNRHLTVGTGSSQPNGVVTASTAGVTAALSSAITSPELLALIHSVDPAYREGPSVGFMFHDTTLLEIRKLVDTQNRPLWQPSIREGEPDRIWGRKYTINQSMPIFGSGNKSVLFGDFSRYVIREVLGVQLLRLTERYADYLQVGFLAFMRLDGELIDAGTRPIRHLVHPSP